MTRTFAVLAALLALAAPAVATNLPTPVASPQADVRATGQTLNAATLNAAVTIALNNGQGVVGFTVTGLTASGATLTVKASNDGGTTWGPLNATGTGAPPVPTVAADGQFRVVAGGHTNVGLWVSTVGTGTITVAYDASSVSSQVPSEVIPNGMYYWNGSAWLPQGAPVGASAGSPGYQVPVCNGVGVSPSAPCSVAYSEPSTVPFSVTANGIVGNIQNTLFGYVEAELDMLAVGVGATFTPESSDNGVNWHTVTICRRNDGVLNPSVGANVNQYYCPVTQTYFQWAVTGYTSGTYTGLTSYHFHQSLDLAAFPSPTPVASNGCLHSYHLSGGSTASDNSTLAVNGQHILCRGMIINTSASVAYLKLYDQGSSGPTCASATNIKEVDPIGVGATVNIMSGPFAIQFNNGVGFCITSGGSDTDDTNGPVGVFVSLSYF